MATYHQHSDLAADATFIARVRNAAEKYALYILPNPATLDPDVRMAKSFIGAPDTWAATFAVALAADDQALTGQADALDQDTDAGDTTLSYALEQRVWPAFVRETSGA